MDQWAILAVIVVAGLVMVSLLKTIVAGIIRYVLFVGMAAAIMKWNNPDLEGYSFLKDLDILQDLAVIGGIGFGVTLAVIGGFFRNSRMKPLLYPIVGFGATFAAWSAWPHILEMWTN